VAAIELANARNFRLLNAARKSLQGLTDDFRLASSLHFRHLPQSERHLWIEIDGGLGHAM